MSKKTTPDVLASVCIPTYNGEDYLEDLLIMTFKQKLPGAFEVIVIDSGSTDRTLDIIKKFPEVRLRQIPNSEFGHGKTRNLMASIAKGEFIAFLSQDAVPSHDRWLEFMLEPFYIGEKVFCVYGKQAPRPHADIATKREVSGVFNSLGPDHSIVINRQKSLMTNKKVPSYLTFFSDVNSAVRREYLINRIPYRDVRYSEDQLLGKDVLEKGYYKAYAPMGSVFHSNEYRIKDYFYRKFDEHLGIYETLGILPPSSPGYHVKRVVGDTIRDFLYIRRDNSYRLRHKFRLFPSSVVRNILKERAAYCVANDRLREKNRSKYSLEARQNSN